MPIFIFNEIWGPFQCEYPDCNKKTFTIQLTKREQDELPERQGFKAANFIIQNGIGIALCDKHLDNPPLCTCPKEGECDCQNPNGEGVAHLSNSCPEHNFYPEPDPECPIHGEMNTTQFATAFRKEREAKIETRGRIKKQIKLPF